MFTDQMRQSDGEHFLRRLCPTQTENGELNDRFNLKYVVVD